MTVAVVFHALIVGLLLVPAAWFADKAATLCRVSRRGIWTAALGAALVLPASAPWRVAATDAAAATNVDRAVAVSGSGVSAVWSVVATGVRDRLVSVADGLAGIDSGLLLLWAASSLVVSIMYATGRVRLRLQRRQWTRMRVHGTPTLISPDTGPAVVGLLSPAMVLPRWALDLDSRTLALILDHEREHIAARDPWLVYMAAVATIVMPWNPVVWWMAARLRLAVEYDCDARVLASRAGASDDIERYGELLLAVATRGHSLVPVGASALTESPSTVSRRIAAMCRSDVRFSRTKTTVAGVCAAMMLAAACGAPAPTASAESPGTVAGPVGPEPTAVRAEPAETHSVVAGHPTATSPTGLVDVPVHRPGPGIVNPIVISSPRPAYTPDAMRRKVQGQVQLEAVIDPTGRVTDATVVKPLDPDLDASAVAAARQWRFEPAKLDGKPVTIAVMLVMQFDIY